MSTKRANYLRDYLITNHKIEASRIVSKGYGESKILNKCKNGIPCTYKEQVFNRRIEVKPIGIKEDSTSQLKHLDELIDEENYAQSLKEIESQAEVKIPENIPVKATPIIAKTKKTETNLVPETTTDKKVVLNEEKQKTFTKVTFNSVEDSLINAIGMTFEKSEIKEIVREGDSNKSIAYTIEEEEIVREGDSSKKIAYPIEEEVEMNVSQKDALAKKQTKQSNALSAVKPIVKDSTKTTKNLEVTYQKLNGKKVAVIKKNPTSKVAATSKDSIITRTPVNYADKKIKVAVIEKPKVVSKELKKETTIEKIAETKIDTAPKSTNGITTETSARVIIKKDSVVKIMTTSEIEKIAEKKEVNEKVENPYATNEEIKTKKEIKDIQKSFTDYTILIIESPVPMKSDDKMLRYQLPILTHQKDSTYNYYLGEFKMWKDAEKYLSIVKRDYPNARIVDFYNGKEYDKK
jgi:hypothetical protein